MIFYELLMSNFDLLLFSLLIQNLMNNAFNCYYFMSLFYLDSWKSLSSALKTEGHSLVPVIPNLIDLVWDDQPHSPRNNVEFLSLNYTGIFDLRYILNISKKN